MTRGRSGNPTLVSVLLSVTDKLRAAPPSDGAICPPFDLADSQALDAAVPRLGGYP